MAGKLINRFQIVILSMLFLTLLSSCNNKIEDKNEDRNPYNLDIIDNIDDYNKMVEAEPEKALVDIEAVIPGVVLDIRYATENNLVRKWFYEEPNAFLRKAAAEALADIQSKLKEQGLAIKVFDAYRPYSATLKFYEVYPDTNFVAAPWRGSVHNRGCAIDLTLIDLNTGAELEMPTLFDDFTEKAGHAYMDLTPEALKNRAILHDAMIDGGFLQYDPEWWHYNYTGWENYGLMNIDFDKLTK